MKNNLSRKDWIKWIHETRGGMQSWLAWGFQPQRFLELKLMKLYKKVGERQRKGKIANEACETNVKGLSEETNWAFVWHQRKDPHCRYEKRTRLQVFQFFRSFFYFLTNMYLLFVGNSNPVWLTDLTACIWSIPFGQEASKNFVSHRTFSPVWRFAN